MKRGIVASALLVLVVTAASLPCRGAPPVDARLRRHVTTTQNSGLLKEYLELLSEQSEIQQKAAASFGERSLVILNVNSSVDHVQSWIARSYHLSWRGSAQQPPEYTLYESDADRKARANALSAARLRGRQRMLARWQAVQQMAFLSEQKLEELAKSDPMAHCLLHPRGSAMGRLLFQLPPTAVDQFWSKGSAQVPASALSSDLQQLVGQAWGNERTSNGRASPEEAATGATIRVDFGGTIDRPTVWGRISLRGAAVDCNLLYAEAAVRQPPEERRQEARKSPSRVPDDPRFKKHVTLKDIPNRPKVFPGERPAGTKPLAVYLRDLARQVALPVSAECEYVPAAQDRNGKWLNRQWWLAADIVDRPVAEALDMVCADFEFEWRFEDGALLLRPKYWFASPKEREYVGPQP